MLKNFTSPDLSHHKESPTVLFRRLSLTLLILLASIPGMTSSAQNVFTIGGIKYKILDADALTCEVTTSSEATGDLILPANPKNGDVEYTLTSIGYEAFYKCSGLTSVTIPESVTSISKSAFNGCIGLTSVTIPESVTSIGENAFSGCTTLSEITIPNTVNLIGEWAFFNCTKLTSVTIPSSVKEIEVGTFNSCSGLTSVVIPNSVESIGESAFSGCSKLTSVEIPNSVKTIGNSAFSNCKALNSVTIPSSVTEIGESVFNECSSLKSVVIPNSVTEIGKNAFKSCSGLKSVEIPNSVTEIGMSAFYDCSGLTSVVMGKSVHTIGQNAFYMCTGLTSVVIGNSVQTIGPGAFYRCSKLTSVVMGNSVNRIGENAFSNCPVSDVYITAQEPPTANDAIFSEYNLYVQGEDAKGKYNNSTCWKNFKEIDVMIPATDITIEGANQISGNPGDTFQLEASVSPADATLKQVIWSSTNPEIATVDNNGLVTLHVALPQASGAGDSDNTCQIIAETLYYGGPQAKITLTGEEDIPIDAEFEFEYQGCTLLYKVIDEAFCQVSKIKEIGESGKVVIPENVKDNNGAEYTVKEIGTSAFSERSGLTSVTIPNSVTSFGAYAFSDCNNLTDVSLPTPSLITPGTFNGCTKLETLTVTGDIKELKKEMLEGCMNFKNISFTGSVGSIGDEAFNGFARIESISFPDEVKSIGNSAFAGCIRLSSFEIPEGVTSIGESAFANSGLTSIKIPENVTFIGLSAFKECSNLNEVEIFGSVNSIGQYLFFNLPKLETVELHEGVRSIKAGAFAWCPKLSTVIIPQSLESIGAYAFLDCNSLSSIVLPKNVNFIDEQAFCGCFSLTSIEIPNGITEIKSRTFYDCIELESIILPTTVTSIENLAFKGCCALTSIELPASVTSIGAEAFNDCSSLTTIELPSALTSMGDNIFEGCTNLSDIYYLTKEPVESEGAWTDDDIYSNAKLHVFPGAATKDKFSNMEPWKGFYDNGNVITLSYADFDMDGSVTIEEAIRIANHVVGNEIQGPFMKELADVNDNNVITISDAVGAVDIVLNSPAATTAAKISAPYTDDSDITDCLVINEPLYAESNLADIDIQLDNTIAYVALQADIQLPEGMMLESVSAGSRAASHTLMQREIGENTYRVVLFNFSSVEFDESSDPLFTLHISNGNDRNGIPVVSNIIASDAKGMKYRFEVSQSETNAVGSIEETKVSVSVEGGEFIISGAEGETASIFTTDGRLVSKCRVGSETVSLNPGIYIVVVGNRSIKTMVK